MKRFISTILIFILLCTLSLAEGVNIVRNGDFSELDSSGLPEDWLRDMWVTDAGVSELSVTQEGPDGCNCAVVLNADPNDARFAQKLDLEPDTTYRFSCMMRAEGCGGTGIGANMSFEGTFVYSDELYDTSGNWQEVVLYGCTGEDQSSATLMLRVGGYSNLSSGKAWFADVQCVEVDEDDIPDDMPVFLISKEDDDGGDYDDDESSATADGEPTRHTETFLLLAFLYALALIAVARRRGRLGELDAKTAARVFALLAVAALMLRVIVSAAVFGYSTDVNCFTAWGEHMFSEGPLNFYSEDYFCDYPPLYMLLLWIPAALRNLLGAPYWSGAQLILLKLIPVLCDIAGAHLVWKVARKHMKESAALLLAGFYLFNPAAIIDSAAWGQIDAVFTLLIVICALKAIDGKYVPSLVAFALAVLIKPQSLLFAPVGLFMMLIWLIREKDAKKTREALAGLVAALLIFYAVGLLFTVGKAQGLLDALTKPVTFLWKLYAETLGSYEYITINALNLYALLDLNWASMDAMPLGTAFAWGMFALSYVYALFLCLKSRKRQHLLLIGATLIMLIFTFGPKIHERYVFPALLLGLLAFIHERDRRILWSMGILTVTLSLNELLVLQGGMGSGNFGHLQSSEQLLNAVISFIGLVNCLIMVWVSGDICIYGNTLPLPAMKAPKNTQDVPSDPKLHLKRREALMMAAVTLVYGVVAFTNLGTLKAPQTGWTASRGGESITVDLGQKETFRLMYYGGICTSNFTVELSNDNEKWTEPCYALYDEGQIFRWLIYKPLDRNNSTLYGDPVDPGDGSAFITYSTHSDSEPYQTARYVRITAASAGLNLWELGFKREDGSLCAAKVVAQEGGLEEKLTDPALLLDEQDTIPERPSYMNSTYFDEIYHARTAYEMLHGMSAYEWTHPPLGKVMIMAGIELFGMTPFGWRFAGAFFGVLMVPLMYLLAKQLTKSSKLSFVAMILLAADSMHFTQSRIATVDSFVVFWIMLEYLFMIRYLQTDWRETGLGKTFIPLGLCGVTMGIAFATKWNGIYSGVGLAVLFFGKLISEWRRWQGDQRVFGRRVLWTILFCIGFFVVVPLVIYLLSYRWQLRYEGVDSFLDMFSKRRIERVVQLQESMFSYHAGLGGDTHPFRSPWYEWPVIARPIWFYSGSEYLPEGMVTSISCMGNPAVWWAGLVALLTLLVASAWKPRARKEWLWMLVGYGAVYLPWVLVPRSMFIYHYFPCVPFMILLTVLAIDAVERRNKLAGQILTVGLPTAAVVLFAAFYPLESGVSAAREYVKHLRWFNWTNY